jgi:AcrR family transcriptional regulator
MTRSINQKSDYSPMRFSDYLEGKEGQILLAAFHCIVERGIAATSTHAIAARAGLNQGIIHYYFKSKDDLLKRLVEILFHNFISNIQTIAKSPFSPAERLETLIESGYTFMDSRRDEFIVMIAFWAHAVSVGGAVLNLFKEHFGRFRETVRMALGEKRDLSPEKSRAIDSVALLIVAGVQGIGLQYALERDARRVESSKRFLKDLLRDALKRRSTSS